MKQLEIDIVSDVVCPWCVVGFLKLQQAIDNVKREHDIEINITWQPFELAPDLSLNGENLREFLAKKYNSSPDASEAARNNLTTIGKELGFDFNFTADMKRFNTFKAHQLLAWAKAKGNQTALKLALFKAYFTDHKDISNEFELALIAEHIGFNKTEVLNALQSKQYEQPVRNAQNHWINQGINSVPSNILQKKYLIPGAQDSKSWQETINKIVADNL